jgi:ubiquitin-like modifier-activating enzyme ATG7
MSGNTQLQFAPFSSALDAGFWHKLSQLKLDVFGLDDTPRPLTGYYCNSDADLLQPRINVDYSAFSETYLPPPKTFASNGLLKNTNTMDEFRNCDKKSLLDAQGALIWDDIVTGRALTDPSLLTRFFLLTFADLKKYQYYYWFAFPALCVPKKVNVVRDVVPISQRFSESQIESLISSYDSKWQDRPPGAFLVKIADCGTLEVCNISDLSVVQHPSEILVAFCDPCTLKTHPGWPLRNLLAMIAFHNLSLLQRGVEVLCFRDRTKDGHRSVMHSIVLSIQSVDDGVFSECPACVGWEKNEKQKLGPRIVDLSASMDPQRLAESAVSLNLKLMRWRLIPDLNLDCISRTRCLLLGAGTLGCNVARCLLGWGIQNITLVDSGSVSYSNPVRQSLLTFEDSLNGGRPKAEAAAQALRRIYPGINAVGVELTVPMPGHAVPESFVDSVCTSVDRLRELFENHDVIFLLMDTRESRWLPTVMGMSMKKIVINAALGFDTYLVVRHGFRSDEKVKNVGTEAGTSDMTKTLSGDRLGCYFCNDVVAPGDSTRDRTLDQQCTVSRPGLSMIASALAVELLISVLVHPLGPLAPADTSSHDEHLSAKSTSPLGVVPHQIRGFLSRFHNMMPASAAFDQCTACSPAVLEAFESGGFDFLLNVFNQPSYLEDLTGLSQLQTETMDSEMWNLSDIEDFDFDTV